MKAVHSLPPHSLSTPGATPRPGQLVGERYRLEEWLESGAMGSVWRAQQVRLRSPVAIKFLDPSLIEVPEMLERFLQEARSAAAVNSAHVIQVFDYGNHGGLPYIAMELLEGENLASRLASRGALTPDELSKIFSEVARGLGQAHALGVIHRDVKPGNIFLAREGKHEVTKLIDFGIAKVKADALRASQIVGTDLGIVMGTPQYMSPEQMRGWAVDHRTDLWALAVIACECLTGRCPFSGSTLANLTVQICTEQPIAPSTLAEVPPGFDQWFFKGTRKDPEERFGSASEMADALEMVLAPVTVRRSTRRWEPLGRDLQHAWTAASRRLRRASFSALDGATAVAARCGVLVQSTLRGMTRTGSAQRPLPPGAWRWVGGAAAGAAVLAVAGSVWLARLPRDPSASGAPKEARAALSGTPLPAPGVASAGPAAAPPESAALPVVTPEELPLVSPRETQPGQPSPAPAKEPAPQRRSKRQDTPEAAERDVSTPASPMSEAMIRLGALIAEGREKPRSAGPRGAPGATSRKAEPKKAEPKRAE